MAASRKVRDVMTTEPVVLVPDASVREAATAMREHDVGAVLVGDPEGLLGLVTDRDIVVRAVAEGHSVEGTRLSQLCTQLVHTCAPEDDLVAVTRTMRDNAIRRLPVIEGTRAVGIVSLGDLAVMLDPDSLLADISAAPPSA